MNELRITLVHLLRIYFNKDGIPDPLDDEKELLIPHNYIEMITDIIIVTSDTYRYNDLWESTVAGAKAILRHPSIKYKLPDSLLTMIALRHDNTIDMSGNTIRDIANDILQSAQQNGLFWEKKREGALRHGYVHPQRMPRDQSQNEYTMGQEGWVPATIQYQELIVHRNSFQMYDWGGRQRERDYRLDISLFGHSNNVPRELDLWGIQYPTPYERLKFKVQLNRQHVWIYADTPTLTLIPKSSNTETYIKLTINTSFPNSVGCMFFAERTANNGCFRSLPPPRLLLVDEDTYEPLEPNRNIGVIGLDTSAPIFREADFAYSITLSPDHGYPDDDLRMMPDMNRAFYTWSEPTEEAADAVAEADAVAAAAAVAAVGEEEEVEEEEEEEEEEEQEYVIPAPPIPRKLIKENRTLPKRIYNLISNDFITKAEECSITMEPLTTETLAITSCFHIFSKTAIARWISGDDTCPQCRAKSIWLYTSQ